MSGQGGGELFGGRVFRGFSRAKERSSRWRDPKVEVWKGWEFSGDGEQCFVMECRMQGWWSMRTDRQVGARAPEATVTLF